LLFLHSPGAGRLAVLSAPLLLAACATALPSPVVPALAQREVSAGGPGAVAWSPDGSTLALVAREGVVLLDLRDGRSRVVSGPGAVAVDWAPGRALLVVERDGAGARAVAVDPATSGRRVLHSAPGLVAARWLHAGAGWMAVARSQEARAYGASATMTVVAATGGEPSERYRWAVELGPADARRDVGLGWTAARPHPLDHRLLLPQYRKPPQFPGRIELVALDLFDPQPEPVAALDLGRGSTVAAWSPDGRRAVVAAADGTLVAVERGRSSAVPTGPARGLHPSWHPGGGAIFLGGWLVGPDGAPLRELVRGAVDAIGEWSPSGDRVAVVAGGRLLVFAVSEVAPPDAAAARRRAGARDSVWRLGTLSSEGLLGLGVYREGRDRQRARAQEGS
jgi:hypothetical protein